MRYGFPPKLVLSLLALFAFATPVLAQVTTLPPRLDLYGGQVTVYKLDRPLARVAVGNGELLQVSTIQKRQLVVIAGAGKSGFTAIHLWFEDGGQRSIDVNVNPSNSTGTSAAVRQMLGPTSRATVADVGGNVVITGEVDAEEATRLDAIKKLYPENVVNLTHVDPVGMKPMVLMDVRIMEVKRDALRELGIKWQDEIDGPSGGAIKDFSSSFYRVLPKGSPFEQVPLPAKIGSWETYFGIATTITSRIKILSKSGDAYELAAPQLSARSGGTATFLAGGEVPIPTVSGFGATSVDFKEYGIRLHLQPTVNSNNEISAAVMTEVSKIDRGVTVQGIPGFLTRKTETEMNVRDGQTIVISGLVDVEGSKGNTGIPGLARIPILGRLFRSDDFHAGRSDLVIFVTPRVITPESKQNTDQIQKSDRMLEDFKKTIGPKHFD